MAKFKCSSCGEIFEGKLEVCPRCGKRMIYKEEPVEDAPVFTPVPVDEPAEGGKGKKKEVIDPNGSYYDGKWYGLFGHILLATLVEIITLGFGTPWAICYITKYVVKHQVVKGRRLKFDGKAGQLFGRYLLWVLLTIVTLTIYLWFLPTAMLKWFGKHITFAEQFYQI